MSELDLGPIKKHIAMMRVIPLLPGDNPTPGDILAKDADSLVAEVERLRQENTDSFDRGLHAVEYIRCMEHRFVPQYNTKEATGAECAACEVERLRERVKVLEEASERWQMLRQPLQAFALEMERQLRENHKRGWKGCSPWQLLDRAREEHIELQQAVDSWADDVMERPSESVIEEAADEANFAMMVADVCGALDVERAANLLRVPPASEAHDVACVRCGQPIPCGCHDEE